MCLRTSSPGPFREDLAAFHCHPEGLVMSEFQLAAVSENGLKLKERH